MVEVVRDKEIGLIQGGAPGATEFGLGNGRSIGESLGPGPRDGRDHVPGHLANPMVEAVGDEQVGRGRGVDADPVGQVKVSRGGRATLAAESQPSTAGHRVDSAADDLADPPVIGVGNEQVTGLVDRNGRGIAQQCVGRGLAVTGVAGLAGPTGHGADLSSREINGADNIIKGIGDEELITAGTQDGTHWIREARVGAACRPGVGRAPHPTLAGQRSDVARIRTAGRKRPHRLIEGIDDVAPTGNGGHGHIGRPDGGQSREDGTGCGELCLSRRLAVAGEARRPIAGLDSYRPRHAGCLCGFQHADQVVAAIGDHDVAVGPNCDRRR